MSDTPDDAYRDAVRRLLSIIVWGLWVVFVLIVAFLSRLFA